MVEEASSHPIERPIRVLIVDDAEEIRLLLRTSLELDGRFEVVGEACDGAEAISLAGAEQPDAVVLDYAMPRVDGLTAIPHIRRCSPRTRILMLSAFLPSLAAAGRREADRYLPKGAALDEINETLVALCRPGSVASS
ncbi:MAG: response regulator transcription factor [Actinomycetota bacterium]